MFSKIILLFIMTATLNNAISVILPNNLPSMTRYLTVYHYDEHGKKDFFGGMKISEGDNKKIYDFFDLEGDGADIHRKYFEELIANKHVPYNISNPGSGYEVFDHYAQYRREPDIIHVAYVDKKTGNGKYLGFIKHVYHTTTKHRYSSFDIYFIRDDIHKKTFEKTRSRVNYLSALGYNGAIKPNSLNYVYLKRYYGDIVYNAKQYDLNPEEIEKYEMHPYYVNLFFGLLKHSRPGAFTDKNPVTDREHQY